MKIKNSFILTLIQAACFFFNAISRLNHHHEDSSEFLNQNKGGAGYSS